MVCLCTAQESRIRVSRWTYIWATRSTCFVWTFVLLGFPAQLLLPSTAGATSMTVDQAVQSAVVHNPDFLSAQQQLVAAEARVTNARYWSQFNPTVEVGANQWRLPGTGSLAEPSVSVSLEVEVAGQRSKRIAEAEQNLDKVRAEVDNVRRSLVAEVKLGFYGALYAKEQLGLAQRIESLNRRLRDAAEMRFKTGQGNKMEANLEAIRYDQSRKNTFSTNRDYQNSLRELTRLVGAEGADGVEPSGAFTQARVQKFETDNLVRTALANRPDLKATDSEIGRVEAEIALTRRTIIPNPIVSGTYQQEPESISPRSDFQIAGGSIGLTIPIFDHKQAELAALGGDRRRASYDRRAVLLNIGTQVHAAAMSYESARDAVQIFESDMVGRIEENFKFIEISYRAGKINLLQLVVVQNDLATANLSYLESLWEFWEARVGLEYAVGTDWDKAGLP